MIFTLFPSILSMVFGVNIFLKSGLIDYLFKFIKLPGIVSSEVLSMIFLRPISGSASLAVLNNIFTKYSPDSISGLIASVIQGSTDTTFYVLTIYFGSIGIKKIKYSLWAGLFADLVGIISAIIMVNIFF